MNDIASDMRGEILIQRPVVSRGYYSNPKVTVDSIFDGWFCTGDIGNLCGEKLYIVDRKKVRRSIAIYISYDQRDIGAYQIQRTSGCPC
jgi:acyl-CoA synthetase (AMP-forming)/AMP-acid ligase II